MPLIGEMVLHGALYCAAALAMFCAGFIAVRWLWARFIDWLLSSKAG